MSLPKRQLLRGVNVGLSIAVFLAILVVIAMIAQGHPYRIDLTRSGKHSLSPQTKKIVESITEPVEIKAFYQEAQQERGSVEDLLQAYAYLSPNITYSLTDPDRQPAQARQYNVKTYGTLTLVGYGKQESITMPDEQTLTRALIRLKSDKKKNVYFLTGHGEKGIDDHEKSGFDSLKSELENANYIVKELNLMRDTVPVDATVIVIAGPDKPLFDEEITALQTFMNNGGRLLVMLPPFQDGGMKNFLAQYGFKLRDDIIIDQMSRLFGGDYLIPMVNSYGRHEITERFTLAAFFPLARGIWQKESLPKGIEITMLASTSPESWAEMDQESLNNGEVEFEEQVDEVGPIWIAAVATISPDFKPPADQDSKSNNLDAEQPAEKQVETSNEKQQESAGEGEKEAITTETTPEPSQIALIGSVDFATNAYLGMSGNYDFILNTISFLAKDKDQIAIRPKTKDMDTLALTGAQSQLLFWISIVFMPALALIAGLTAYRIRRRSR